MTTKSELTSISKFLSLVLRHAPQRIGLTLDAAGWTPVDALLQRAAAAGRPLTRERLAEVVATSDKQRFAFNEHGTHIRASQGHSVEVALGLAPVAPPAVLYHGTATRFLEAILREGLDKRRRHHVHLSLDPAIARSVGQRHGDVVLLQIDAARMQAEGHVFFRSDNGVWLTDAVPARYLSVLA